ncbi:MAG: efflux RND transporter periplasmic adaptor subunit [Verrucomicrobiota bacterium]
MPRSQAVTCLHPVCRPTMLLLLLAFVSPVIADQERVVPVEVLTVLRATEVMEKVKLTGTVSSQRRARLSPRTVGLVESVEVEAGDHVAKGDLLVKMDSKLADIELDLVRAQIETAEIQSKDAIRRFDEVKELIEEGAFARTEAGTLQASAAISGAELKVLQVREQQARERIERHRVLAPFAGVIARKATEVGEWVDTGTMVLELVGTGALWFDLQIAQEFVVAAVRGAERAEVTLDAFPGQTMEAEVDVVVPVKDPVSRTFLTRLTFDDKNQLASPGMSGTATLFYRPRNESASVVPRDAVVRTADGKATVWVVTESNGRATVRPVTIRTAGSLGNVIEVTEGLKGGEKVVVRGNEGLKADQTVTVRQHDPANEPALR